MADDAHSLAERLEARAKRMNHVGDGLQYYGQSDAALDTKVAALLRQMAAPGWRLVPVKPTREQIAAGCKEHRCEQGDPWYGAPDLEEGDAEDIYRAMLSAAPSAPTGETE